MCKRLLVPVFLVILFVQVSVVCADVDVPKPFTDYAVLQREKPVPVWGTASVGEEITVDFNGQSKSVTADSEGEWIVYLDPMPASTSPSDLVITGDNVITFTDVQVGEVWLFSGQSNMWFNLESAIGGAEAVADSANHNISMFLVVFTQRDLERTDWQVVDPSTAGKSSAVAYFMAHELSHALGNIPIGMLQASKGGTDIVEWTHASGGAEDGLLYEWKVVPMQPWAIRGFVWYQGENDGADPIKAADYEFNLNGLISEWRTGFEQGSIPVGVVQLHDHSSGINPEGWPVVQDAQLLVSLADSNVGLAAAWDLSLEGSPGHPDTKEPIGERLGLWARSEVYDEPGLTISGPVRNPAASYIDGDEIVIAFDHVGGGLITNDGASPAHFEVTGYDGIRHIADAQIIGDTVVVSSPDEPNPITVTHVWTDQYWPLSGALYNAEMLPAPVFEMTLPDGSYCGDGTCDPAEDECNCSDDCGAPPLTETICDDGIDEDCDTYIDCDDIDCDGDPACPSSECGNDICEEGEDCLSCADDCEGQQTGPPSGRFCCGNGVEESAEGDGSICDGNY
jgi:sialate O-acetylesterase